MEDNQTISELLYRIEQLENNVSYLTLRLNRLEGIENNENIDLNLLKQHHELKDRVETNTGNISLQQNALETHDEEIKELKNQIKLDDETNFESIHESLQNMLQSQEDNNKKENKEEKEIKHISNSIPKISSLLVKMKKVIYHPFLTRKE